MTRTRQETKAVLIEQRDRARDLVRALTVALRKEHDRRCECGRPSCGDCRTQTLLGHADKHVKHWEATAASSSGG